MADNTPVVVISRGRHFWPGWCALALLWSGCRVPDPPILRDHSHGAIYDTAQEQELRAGKAHALVQTTLVQYIDTLSEPVAITDWNDETSRWEIFVATNRGHWDGNDNQVLDAPRYGRADVVLPRQQRGAEVKLASTKKPRTIIPAAWRRGSLDKDAVATMDSASLSTEEFLAGVNRQLKRSRQHDLLIFVHGFNVGFDAAVVRTAQLALDVPFNGAVVAYCWPSQGGVFNYDEDEPINKASVAPFAQFLQTLRAGVPAETRINIVVHSMGNRIVMEALNQLPPTESRKPFANVVLCAPDVGRRDFLTWAPGVMAQAERVTMYASPSDSALIASQGLHGERRAGDAWQPILVEGIELVDCGRVDLNLMGHSYYGSNIDVLCDLFQLLKEDRSASERNHLEAQTNDDGQTYWSYARSAEAIHWTWHFEEQGT